MMEHVEAKGGRVQHLADVGEDRWQQHEPADGVQFAPGITTLCGKTLGIAVRVFANPADCKRCRKRVDDVGRQLEAARLADEATS